MDGQSKPFCNWCSTLKNDDNLPEIIDILAWVAELVDARDLKSLGPCDCTSSILVPGTT